MKPFTYKQRQFIYRWLINSRCRIVTQSLYHFIIRCELSLQILMDYFARHDGKAIADLSKLTAIVKTFERTQMATRLVKSIRRFYPSLQVIVVDDSRHPIHLDGVTTVVLPYDSGISAGRNEGLQQVQTKYTLVLDDDFVFTHKTRLQEALRIMEDFPEIDILGGKVIDLPLYIAHDLRQAQLLPTKATPVFPLGTHLGGLTVVDKVPNFFIGRTERLKLVQWDSELKRLDHADFFTRARGVLTTVSKPDFSILHAKNPFDIAYMMVRYNLSQCLKKLQLRYGGIPQQPTE
ncbi:glycosyltransferase family 2 protein [Candidatus Entotheonella palauensis]|uniref:glycosyltransferase family 2 protein n=1 Tax=Candidatus Entotheonella palauensis TaxID=93172 RepID=UPI000B7F9D85|nr:glycosyltransferase family 2 protein [Candidatus Entotheonella palauensis]